MSTQQRQPLDFSMIGSFTITREKVSPETAREWLELNHERNRKVIPTRVQNYAADMRSGRWRLSHQGIAFDSNGHLVDGQHRLHAVVVAGVPIDFHIYRGVSPDSLTVLDIGAVRREAHMLQIAGEHASSTGVAIARRMALGAAAVGRHNLTKAAVCDFYLKHQDAVLFALRFTPGHACTAACRAVVGRAWYSVDRERLLQFGRILDAGSQEPEDRAAVLLRRYLAESNARSSSGTMQIQLYQKAQRSLSAWLSAEPITRLYAETKEQFPIPS